MEVAELILRLDSIIDFLTNLLSETSEIGDNLPIDIIPGETAERLFMTTPLDQYTVTEGLLLVIVIMLILAFLYYLWEQVW